jgi:aromatic ring-opening dioxygenase catalytic subunit (LigB family)
MYYDYSGFPLGTYKYQYPAPGSPDLVASRKIKSPLKDNGLESELDEKGGFDHGVFVTPRSHGVFDTLMLMYPTADIPVVWVSFLHCSLAAKVSFRRPFSFSASQSSTTVLKGMVMWVPRR